MTARPWMPLYVGDYLADTGHLRTIEHGAYLLLIMHYWRVGHLPVDDSLLAHVARVSLKQWRHIRPAVEPLFQTGWKHKRIEFELTESARISAAGKIGGQASAAARRAKSEATTVERPLSNRTNDQPTIGQPLHLERKKEQESKKDSGPDGPDAPAPQPPVRDIRKDLFDRGLKSLATMTGKTPDSCRSLVGKWLASVHDEAIHVLAAIDDAERNRVADPVAWISRSIQPRTVNGSIRPTVHTAVATLLDRVRSIDQPGPSDLRHRKG